MIQGIQSTIGGFQGAPVTVFSALDDASGVLTVAAIGSLHKARRDDCVVLGNILGLERDMEFSDSDIRTAIDAWNAIRHDRVEGGHPRLVFTDRARKADPSSLIESDGLNEHGRQWRLAEHVGNEAVAVLATCLWAHRADTRESVLGTAEGMVGDILSGRAVTVAGFQPWEVNPVFVHGFQVDQRAAGAYWDQRDRKPYG